MPANPSPVHLLAGGPGGRRDAYRGVVREILQAPGKPKPLVAYVAAATDDDPRFARLMEQLVVSAAACTFRLAPVAGEEAGAAARQVIDAADVVFLGGGDVELGMRRLQERDLVGVLREKHARGAPFFGISAGAILLAQRWIRWADPDDDGSAELFDCLGLAPVLCDCHGEEDGWAELRALLRLAGDRAAGHGLGLRSGSAVRVTAEGAVETVCGAVDRFAVSDRE